MYRRRPEMNSVADAEAALTALARTMDRILAPRKPLKSSLDSGLSGYIKIRRASALAYTSLRSEVINRNPVACSLVTHTSSDTANGPWPMTVCQVCSGAPEDALLN